MSDDAADQPASDVSPAMRASQKLWADYHAERPSASQAWPRIGRPAWIGRPTNTAPDKPARGEEG